MTPLQVGLVLQLVFVLRHGRQIGSAHICWKVDTDQGFEDAATRPPFKFDDFVGGDESFGKAGSKYHLGRGGPDARGWCCSLASYFDLSGPCCTFQD